MSPVTAQVSKTIDATSAQIWTALTVPACLKQFFFGADVESDWKIGHPIRMTGEFKGKAYEDKGEILEIDPGERLSFSHWSAMSGMADKPENYHVVSFDLSPDGKGTKVTLSQSNLRGDIKPSDLEHRAEYEKNWRTVLDGLEKVVTKEASTH
jgi:uncharacterized protein YndB with AHSA1/START domain